MKRLALQFLAIVVGCLALYTLTAQRGLGWGDSGEFQYRVLHGAAGLLSDCDSFATAHPLYVALAKACCSTPFQITLISSVFGALAVGGFFLCSRNLVLTILLALAHGVWWLSCVAEVYTMSLTFLAFETLFLLRYLKTRQGGWLIALFLLNGLHLELHNLALLSLPVYLCLLVDFARRSGVARAVVPILSWVVGASFFLSCLVTRGFGDVLVGRYGSAAVGLLPSNWTVTGFNLALAAMSFLVPVELWWWHRKETGSGRLAVQAPILALFVIHFLFFVRYFIISQFTFVLPSVFFAYLLVSELKLRRDRAISLVIMQILLPVFAWQVLSGLPRPDFYAQHRYRDDAKYFALPWKFNDDSADRYAAELESPWNGYPDCGGRK